MFEYVARIKKWYNRPKSKTVSFVQEVIVIGLLVFIIRTWGFSLYKVPTGSMETTVLTGELFFADKLSKLFVLPKHGDVISFNSPLYGYSSNKLMRLWQLYVYGPENWTKRVIGIPGDHIKGTIEDGKPIVYRNGQRLEEPYVNHYPLVATLNYALDREFAYKSYVPELNFGEQPFYKMTYAEVLNGKERVQKRGASAVRMPFTPCEDFSTFGTEQPHACDVFDVQLDSDEYWMMGDNRQGSYDSRFWGPLKKEFIHGRVLFRLYSIDARDSLGIFENLVRLPLLDLAIDLIRHPIEFWAHVRWSRCLNVVR